MGTAPIGRMNRYKPEDFGYIKCPECGHGYLGKTLQGDWVCNRCAYIKGGIHCMSIQPIDRLNQFVLEVEAALELEFDSYWAVKAALDKLKGVAE